MPQIGDIIRARDRWPNKIYSGDSSPRAKYKWEACRKCGKERWVYQKGSVKATSGLCLSCGQNGIGRYESGGYARIRLQRDDFFFPMASSNREVLEHRLVMAKHLNRCLLPWEVVHHKNGIKNDNRIENLELIKGQYNHISFIILQRENNQLKAKVRELEIALEKASAKGIS